MRLLRLRLRNIRGVEEREVVFLRDGVTVVVGPNEIGKSSMAEALDLLFTAQDSSQKAEVKAVKPVDRDAGPEVEAEIETGDYAFTYRKRFVKSQETVLQITRPRPEHVTGRQAHERVEQILEQTMDIDLWRAVRIKQGEGLGQAVLGDAQSLGRALDRAAGTVHEGQLETTLFDRAKEEYEAYWTPGGKLKGDFPLRTSVTQHQAALDGIESQMRAVAADVDRDADLTAERTRLADAKGPETARVAELEARWRQIEELTRNVEKLEETEKAARVVAEQAAEASRGRAAAAADLAAAEAERVRLKAAVEAAAPALASARERSEHAATSLADARIARETAEAHARTTRDDLDFLRARQALAEHTRTRETLVAARAALAAAEAAARSNLVDPSAIEAIRLADREVQVARALLDAGRPSVVLTALRDVTVLVDGAPSAMRAGESAPRHTVTERLTVEVAGTLRVEVDAGAGEVALAERGAEAERALRAACERAGVTDLAAAEAAATARREAMAARTEQKRRITELLGGDEPGRADQLEMRIALHTARIAAYLESRAGAAMPGDEEAAASEQAAADRAADEARTAESTLEREDRAAREQLAEREVAASEANVRLDLAETDVATRALALEERRAALPDGAIAESLGGAVAAHEAAKFAAAAARLALEGEGPETARALLDNARRVVDGMAENLRALEISQAEVRARLRDHGEDGLAERRDAEVTARDAASAELERWLARAEARRKLYEALKTARDAAHLAYVGPLRDKLTSLGKVVFGASLGLEVGEDLRVRSRTLDGRTVPYESLSIGAREQLGVLTRLACAMLVAEDGGVPVMLDDTLGFSDPRRLEAMGAVLSLAGASCQVIVLTCYPDRYRHVGGARTVLLS